MIGSAHGTAATGTAGRVLGVFSYVHVTPVPASREFTLWAVAARVSREFPRTWRQRACKAETTHQHRRRSEAIFVAAYRNRTDDLLGAGALPSAEQLATGRAGLPARDAPATIETPACRRRRAAGPWATPLLERHVCACQPRPHSPPTEASRRLTAGSAARPPRHAAGRRQPGQRRRAADAGDTALVAELAAGHAGRHVAGRPDHRAVARQHEYLGRGSDACEARGVVVSCGRVRQHCERRRRIHRRRWPATGARRE